METKLFHGDIEAVEIPDGGLELAPGIMMYDKTDAIWTRCIQLMQHSTRAYCFPTVDHHLWQSLRTLFLRQPSEDENAE